MLTIARETSLGGDVLELLRQSDEYSAERYPSEGRYPLAVEALSAPNVRMLVARDDGRAVGFAALVLGPDGRAELKRMIVDQNARGRGIGRALLTEVERVARAEGVRLLQLETGPKNFEAIVLYRRSGYAMRGPFGDYRATPWSLFMEKAI